jgi:hypothetical protein
MVDVLWNRMVAKGFEAQNRHVNELLSREFESHTQRVLDLVSPMGLDLDFTGTLIVMVVGVAVVRLVLYKISGGLFYWVEWGAFSVVYVVALLFFLLNY